MCALSLFPPFLGNECACACSSRIRSVCLYYGAAPRPEEMSLPSLGDHWESALLLHVRLARALGVTLPTSGAGVDRVVRDAMIVVTGANGSSDCWQNCSSPCPNTTTACLCPVRPQNSAKKIL